MRSLCNGVSFKMGLVRHVINAIAKVGQVGATQGTGLGGWTNTLCSIKRLCFSSETETKIC